ncbi:hypothetical protein [Streptomyces sp. NPDC050560]|uniref:hypothetical protein n=1 Tax=Streptomyces sp. NPDC050560 TaxID=3365630 RepID=UPI00379185F2
MTVCATEEAMASGERGDAASGRYAVSACGSHAARLNRAEGAAGAEGAGGTWSVERWALHAPVPYAVSLPVPGATAAGDEVLPLPDGRVVLRRGARGRQRVSLLCPSASGTVERPLAEVYAPGLRLLPAAPDGACLHGLETGDEASAVWVLAGERGGPRRVAELPGRCSGGIWLDRAGRLLAVDVETAGAVRTVLVDLARGGAVAPLLEIAEHSTDRLLGAEQGSGLLLIGSDAASPGRERLAWGVLGSGEPVRFPACVALPGQTATVLSVRGAGTAAECAVALRVTGADGTCVGLWRPGAGTLHQQPVPPGWLDGVVVWGRDGALGLPCAGGAGVVWLPEAPARAPRPIPLREAPLAAPGPAQAVAS